ncbi:hypothetical protein VNI00_001825 [Paramarasmius palmivorus]|uniref:Uncharacterized protein n=1 Tax=Paramarasmius palmivorus TaxID=297713 RepID=A0AAW0E1H9_9AGAR
MSGRNLSDSDAGPSRQAASGDSRSTTSSFQHPSLRFPSDAARRFPTTRQSPLNATLGEDLEFSMSGVRRVSDGSTRVERRRVVSVDATAGTPFYTAPRSKRNQSINPVSSPPNSIFTQSEKEGSPGFTTLSDEYDLSQEGIILQDVERALKMKARREARLKSGKSPSSAVKRVSLTSTPPSTSPSRVLSTIAGSPTIAESTNPNSPPRSSHTQEIDFSPATEPFPATPPKKILPHPVPLSPDDGASLDWSGTPEDERRWSLSSSRRKGKEKDLLLSAAIFEKQEHQHNVKLSRIKTLASPQTLRKAAITADQLGRRYHLIFNSLSPGARPYNLTKVVQWFGSQDSIVRSALLKAEPLTWMKHLERKYTSPHESSPWHLSALIMEEYLHAQSVLEGRAMASIPEELQSSPLIPSPQLSGPLFPSPSRTSSRFSLGPSTAKHTSTEGRISFEPLVESGRHSLESHGSIDSALSSVGSQSRTAAVANLPSPAGSGVHLRDGLRRRVANGSDGFPSPRNSVLEHSDDNAEKLRSKALHIDTGVDRSLEAPNMLSAGDESRSKGIPHESGVASKRSSLAPPSPFEDKRLTVPKTPGRTNRGVVRISLPPSERESVAEQRRQQEADDAQTDREYQLKAQMLEQYRAQNSRIRGLLNRIASGVREYEMCQSGLMNYLGLPYKGLPQDLLEAFSHDPAAVTGSTRRLKSWRAVDDIHARLTRQRAVFEEFLASDNGHGGFPVTHDVLQEPILALIQSLDQLEAHKVAIASKAKEVSELLRDTQQIHNTVKTEYNETLAHTSVVYPELSQIVALEESYRDQYQHVWEIGMDALTFILDTVTPFWRTYGKTIGYDVQDFLIIPLYRNEFTGEPKRYPITRLPRRSFRHWMGLLLFFGLCATVTLLQARAAVSSSLNYRLDWVKYGIRWVALPIFWIVIFAQWVAVFIELAIVLLQVATVCWWIGWAVKLFH